MLFVWLRVNYVMLILINGIIICANFGVRGVGCMGNQCFGASIEMAGHSYNSAACDV